MTRYEQELDSLSLESNGNQYIMIIWQNIRKWRSKITVNSLSFCTQSYKLIDIWLHVTRIFWIPIATLLFECRNTSIHIMQFWIWILARRRIRLCNTNSILQMWFFRPVKISSLSSFNDLSHETTICFETSR